jgi:hypothetical protein
MTHRSWAEIQELRSQVQELDGTVVSQNFPPTDSISMLQRSQVRQMSTTNNSIMGERNDQAKSGMTKHTTLKFEELVLLSRSATCNQLLQSLYGPIHRRTEADNECNTNIDTGCLGKNFVVSTSSYRTADVNPDDTFIKPIANVPIVPGATAYNEPISGDTYILVFNNSFYYGSKFDHTLIDSNQLRAYGM